MGLTLVNHINETTGMYIT